MKNADFKVMTPQEKRCRLFKVLDRKGKKQLAKNELSSIIDKLDMNTQFKISVFDDADEFAKSITLSFDEHSDSNCDSSGYEETAQILLGKVEFGKCAYSDYWECGNQVWEDSEIVEPDFNVKAKAAVLITRKSWDGRISEDITHELVIYIPKVEPFLIEEELADEKTKILVSNSFKELTEKRLRARLLLTVRKKCNNQLSDEELEKTVNNIDINNNYEILVFNDSEAFAKEIILKDYEERHSWAGSGGEKEEAFILFGEDVVFGSDYSYEYFNNGNSDGPETKTSIPDFDVTKKVGIMIENHAWQSWERESGNYDKRTFKLVFYLPTSEHEMFKFSKEERSVIAKFNIK